jgi:hypothetical protein
VEVVLKTSYSTEGQSATPTESKYELTGTVIDPSGLAVVALSGCEPAEFYKRVVPGYSRYKMESEISDLKILLDDETEVPAEIVLRDKDLDLAFIRPKTPLLKPILAVDLTRFAPTKVLDHVIMLNRLNRASARAYSASVERIIAVIRKPRTFYVPDTGSGSGAALGSPAFSLDGNILGVIVMRVGSASASDYRENAASVILPAEEILKSAKQVPPGKPKTEPQTDKKEANRAK